MRNIGKTKLFRTFVLIVIAIVAIGGIRSLVGIWQKRGIVEERKVVLEAEQKKHAELENKLKEATSAAFIEKTARNKLGLVKPGENVVIMNKATPEAKLLPQFEKPRWRQWWELFF